MSPRDELSESARMADLLRMSGNLRAVAGMHLVRQDKLAEALEMSRQAVNNLFSGRSGTHSETAIKLTRLFGVSFETLYEADRVTCLRAAIEAYDDAPIRAFASEPEAHAER
jgi:plasmid maintenance system antidote protein VapI